MCVANRQQKNSKRKRPKKVQNKSSKKICRRIIFFSVALAIFEKKTLKKNFQTENIRKKFKNKSFQKMSVGLLLFFFIGDIRYCFIRSVSVKETRSVYAWLQPILRDSNAKASWESETRKNRSSDD